jgi:hypothetical protein
VAIGQDAVCCAAFVSDHGGTLSLVGLCARRESVLVTRWVCRYWMRVRAAAVTSVAGCCPVARLINAYVWRRRELEGLDEV